jgi:superfamily II DNA or RNA helicase
MRNGLYEELVSKLIESKISQLGNDKLYIKKVPIDKAEAAHILSQYLLSIIKKALGLVSGPDALDRQIEISNKIIQLLKTELGKEEFSDDLIGIQGQILKAILEKLDADFSDFESHLKEITPYTRLTHSELFTGGNLGISMESELKKEILSADRIDFLVSFIKWKGLIVLLKELEKFTEKGGKLRVITTTYMGATDAKAIEVLSKLKNTEVKISYNTGNERLHAKAYLFFRNTGFHTGYIGSSNMSRTALTDGLEWNLKITTKEVGHIIDKFQKTFESYWQNIEFEQYHHEADLEKLSTSLIRGKNTEPHSLQVFFDVKPHHFQSEILEKLEVERTIHGRYRNLIVAATGTGKTVISAFDYKRFKENNPSAKLLFVAHRKEILEQARGTFRAILRDQNFGELWIGDNMPDNFKFVFASVQTLNNQLHKQQLSSNYYDYIVIDEVHHIAASSYRPVLNSFSPKVLLGLTATPERMDGSDILEDFGGRIASEIRLPEALNLKLLCPFQYFGITDSIDLAGVKWSNGKYVPGELSKLYTANDIRVGEIIYGLDKYLSNPQEVRALGFCATIEHAQFMAKKFELVGLKAAALTSQNNAERAVLRENLRSRTLNYLFVVDIFNEGVDIPEIDTVLFLRPTESLTIFLQQFGRGLRLAKDKDCLTVLDFVGNARPEYDFENKFRALIGKTNTPVLKEIEDDFPHLPLGCSIILEKKAKETILENVRKATQLGKKQLIQKIQNFKHQTNLPLKLSNFLAVYNLPIQAVYKSKWGWKRLCAEAKAIPDFENPHESEITKAIANKWLSTRSSSYFSFLIELAKKNFQVAWSSLSEIQNRMCLMIHYDVWGSHNSFTSLEQSLPAIGKNEMLVSEIIEVLEILIDKIDFQEKSIILPFHQPLLVHSRYTRDQILVAFNLQSFNAKTGNIGGVAENKSLNTEILFIDLLKSEEDFSPTTMYEDYAINDTLFHWQSQNDTRPDTGKGLSYINHKELNKKILLFVREKGKDEFRSTMGFVFLGEADFISSYGSKPMSITWQLKEPIPNYLWKDSAKMAVG